MSKDFDGTLKKAAQIGYEEVELHNFFDKPAAWIPIPRPAQFFGSAFQSR